MEMLYEYDNSDFAIHWLIQLIFLHILPLKIISALVRVDATNSCKFWTRCNRCKLKKYVNIYNGEHSIH